MRYWCKAGKAAASLQPSHACRSHLELQVGQHVSKHSSWQVAPAEGGPILTRTGRAAALRLLLCMFAAPLERAPTAGQHAAADAIAPAHARCKTQRLLAGKVDDELSDVVRRPCCRRL